MKVHQRKFLPWCSCIVVALYFGYEMLQLTLMSTLTVQWMQWFNITPVQFSLLSSAYLYGVAASLIPIGLLLDRLPVKPILLVTLALAVLGTFLMAFTSSIAVAIVARGIIGIGNGCSFLGYMKLVSQFFSGKTAAFAKSLIYAIGMVGCILSQAPLLALINHQGLRGGLVIIGLAGMLLLLLMQLLVNPQLPIVPPISRRPFKLNQAIKLASFSLPNILCGLYACFANIPMVVLGALWGKAYLTQVHQLSAYKAAQVTSLIFLGCLFGSPCWGWLAGLVNQQRYNMLAAAIIGIGCFVGLAYIPSQIAMLAVLFFMLGILTSAQLLSVIVITKNNPAAIEATCLSIMVIIINLGGAIYQFLFSLLLSHSAQGFKHAFLMVALSFLLSGIMACFIHEKKQLPRYGTLTYPKLETR